MAFTPAPPLNLVYKKYTTVPAPASVSSPVPSGTAFIAAPNLPNWLQITNISIVGTTATWYLKVYKPVADTMAPGNYSVTLNMQAINYSVNPPIIADLGTFTVNITIQNTIILAVSPTVMTFNYTIGDATPATKPLQITSENSWNITSNQSWVTLSAASGSNNGTIQIGVNPASLSFGVYTATVTVNDGVFTRDITVYFTIVSPTTPSDYLYLNPQSLEFLSQQGVANAVAKSMNIDSGGSWTAVSSQTWLDLAASSGAGGVTDVAVTVDSVALAEGVYTGEITVTSSGIIKKIYVTLRVVTFSVEGLENDTLYFAEDRNKLTVGSITDNSFLILAIEASTATENDNYKITQPYYRGIGKALVGLEANKLIGTTIPTNNFTTRVKNTINPISMDITAYDEQRFSGVTTSVAQYQNIMFLKGKTPKVTGRLSYIPTNIVVSNQAIIQLSVLSATAPASASITGAITASISNGLADGLYVYTLLVNLAEYTLVQADAIAITFGGQTVNVQIDNSFVERNTIAFENEWGEYEFFETKGFLSRTSTVDKKTQSKSEDGLSHERILEAPEDAEFSLNTGYIFSQAEVDWISKILNSKRVFIYLEGEPVEVILTTKKMDVYETRNFINSYSLNFKKAIV